MTMDRTIDRTSSHGHGAAVARLHDDQRGAVMVMGLFMSMLMIGALWCMIGLGDAMVFRQRMQEASDHAAFASAVVHAKGMNFIAMLNAVMLVLTIIYILMGIVHDILALLCVMTGFACVPFKAWQTAWHAYFNAMKPICKALHVAEEAVAYAAPWVGFGVGMQLGQDYGQHTMKKPRVMMLAMSSSMAPGRFPSPPGNGVFGSGFSKYGLPVEAKPFSALCDKVGKLGGGGLLGMTGQSAGAASGVISGLISRGVKYRYCSGFDIAGFVQGNDTQTKSITGVFGNFMSFGKRLVSRFMSSGIGQLLGANDPSFDGFWNEDGPLYVYSNANNGSPFMQVWSVNLYPQYTETSTRRVGIAANMIGSRALENTAPPFRTYFAQAEFYYDCTKDWADDDCNGDPGMDANASYNMRWTTRLHAFEGNFGEMLGSAFSSLLTSGLQKGLSSILQHKLDSPVPRFIADKLGNALGGEIANDIGLGKDGALRKDIQGQLDFLNMPTQAYH